MEYRKMGKTGLQLSALSFGSWVTFHKQIDDRISDELMGIAYDHGVNFFDNAEVYAGGESEKMMGRVLSKKNWDRTSYTISSKAYFGWRGKENKPNQTGLSRKHLTEACHEALKRLQTDYLDLYFCHRPDKTTPIEEVVQTMNTLIQQGKILYWGTSEWSGVEIMEAHRVAAQYRLIGPSMEQPQYNLFERHKMENEYLEIFKNQGLGTTIWSPLASGLLTGKYNDGIPDDSRFQLEGYEWLRDRWVMQDKIKRVQQLGSLAKALKVSMASLSIAWCIKNPNVTTAILGATKKEQLLDNLTAMDTLALLTPEIMEQIEGIVETKPVLPEW
jgi:voltage-dependent potassium channel beta subunit